jgi:hypothetical protein
MLPWERIRPQIHGLGPYLALKLVAEYGDHLSTQGRASNFFAETGLGLLSTHYRDNNL